MALQTYSYLGKGKIYLRSTSGGGAMPIGNCSALNLSVETNSVSQPNYQVAGGGVANELQRVASVSLAMTMLEFRPKNLQIALRGTIAAVTAAAVADERHEAYADGLVAFDHAPDKGETITVTLDPDGTPEVLTLNTDYQIAGAGIVMLDSGNYLDGDQIGVAYTKVAGDVIEAMTGSGDEYELIFDGLNEAETDKAVIIRVYRVKWSPTSGLGFIGDDFGELPLEGSVLVDSTKVGAGISQYFKATFANE
jgi:hypothetical protein